MKKFSLLSKSMMALVLILSFSGAARAAENLDLENTLYLDLKYGRVVIELFPRTAPKHVARIKELARQKFYDGLKFHRVIEGFMAQTGDPDGNGRGGSGRKIRAEFSNIPHDRGIVSMARASSPHSADSQFFIVLQDSSHLDRKYSVFGKVVSGMEFVDQVKKGYGQGGQVRNPDLMLRLRVAADVQ